MQTYEAPPLDWSDTFEGKVSRAMELANYWPGYYRVFVTQGRLIIEAQPTKCTEDKHGKRHFFSSALEGYREESTVCVCGETKK